MDIIGFDAQINAPTLFKGVRTIAKKMVVKPAAKPMARPVAKPMARPAAKPMARPAAKPMARPVAKPMARPAAKPMARPVTKFAPAQVPFKVTAKTATNIKPTSSAASKAPLTVVKASGRAIPVKTLEQTTNPAAVKSVSPIQRSFMPVDLPFQTPTPQPKPIRIKNTPYAYNINVNQIEPAVDAGVQDYYGK
jgi:hypothetical protein